MQIVFFINSCLRTEFLSAFSWNQGKILHADNLLRMALMGRKHFVSAKHIMGEFKVIKLQSMYF